jgi:hypothetical protein
MQRDAEKAGAGETPLIRRRGGVEYRIGQPFSRQAGGEGFIHHAGIDGAGTAGRRDAHPVRALRRIAHPVAADAGALQQQFRQLVRGCLAAQRVGMNADGVAGEVARRPDLALESAPHHEDVLRQVVDGHQRGVVLLLQPVEHRRRHAVNGEGGHAALQVAQHHAAADDVPGLDGDARLAVIAERNGQLQRQRYRAAGAGQTDGDGHVGPRRRAAERDEDGGNTQQVAGTVHRRRDRARRLRRGLSRAP